MPSSIACIFQLAVFAINLAVLTLLPLSQVAAQTDPSSHVALDVRRFGVKCDGTSDDFPAISAAIASALQRGGGEVHFPPGAGPCMLSQALVLPEHVNLSATAGTVTLRALPKNMSKPMLLSVRSNTIVDGLSFDGGGADHANAATVIQAYKVSDVTFSHISVQHTRGIALLLSSQIVRATVRDSTFEDIGNHWKTTGKRSDRKQAVVFCCGSGNEDNHAVSNTFSDIGLDALQFSNQNNISATGNHMALQNSQRNLLSSPDYASGIFLLDVSHAMISDNIISGAQGNCIDSPGISFTTFKGNTLSDCGAAGIGLLDTQSYGGPRATNSNVVISGNTISRNNRWKKNPFPGGIYVSGKGSSEISIEDNDILDSPQIRCAVQPQNSKIQLKNSLDHKLLVQPDSSCQAM